MTERDLLLRAILANPDDDTARLVYADKLDELGGKANAARAEFIRVQVELARTPAVLWARGTVIGTGPDGKLAPYTPDGSIQATGFALEDGPPNPRHAELSARETALLKRWYLRWLPTSLRAPVGEPTLHVLTGPTVPAGVGYARFERGFVAHAGCEIDAELGPGGFTLENFAARARALFQANPLTGLSLSFVGTDGALHAEISTGTNGTDNPPHWRVSWDINTLSMVPRDAIEPPVTLYHRDHVGGALEAWLRRAVVEPARLVAARQFEQEMDEGTILSFGAPPYLMGGLPGT